MKFSPSKFISFLAVTVLLIGAVMLLFSFKLKPYSNEDEYNTLYMTLKSGDSVKFFELRNKYLTSKYLLFDRGSAIVVISIIILSAYLFRYSLKVPKNKFTIIFLGTGAVVSTIWSEIYTLYRDYERGEFPHWSDSLSIPLAQLAILGMLLFIWVFIHYFFFIGKFSPSEIIFLNIFSIHLNPWLGLISFLTVILILNYIYEGSFLHVISGCIWLYFYLSLAAGGISAKKENGN